MKIKVGELFRFKLKGKLMSAYILLFFTFSFTIFLVSNIQINKIVSDSSRQQINTASKTGMSFLNQSFTGNFQIINGKLYRGDIPLETDTVIVDKISRETDTYSAIFNYDKCVSTSIKDEKGQRYFNIKVSDDIKKAVLENLKEYTSEIIINNKKYEARFIPLVDGEGKAVGMWLTAADKSKVQSIVLKVNLIIGITALIFILVGIFAINLFINKLLKNVRSVSSTVKQLGEGNLNVTCNIHTYDEIKEIADSVDITAENMRGLVRNISNIIKTLNDTSSTISSTSEGIGVSSDAIALAVGDVSRGAVAQTEKIKECNETIYILSQKIDEMNAQTENTIKNALEMKKSNEAGIISLEDLKEKLEKNVASSMAVSQQIDKLSECSTLIGNIVSTIKTIADKTNLLALNASIEAARAGEAGRGFTVVADEIRKLAEQSKTATEEINNIIQETTDIIVRAKVSVDEGNESVKLSNNSMVQTEQAFIQVNTCVNKLIDEVVMLKNNLKDVNDSKKQVIHLIEHILLITEQFEATTKEVNSATEEQAASIQEIVASLQEQNTVVKELSNSISIFSI